MAITVNTNIPSLIAQKNLNSATSSMNVAMERMSTGYRINSSKDDAAGMAVSSKMDYKVGSLDVAQQNGQIGINMLDTTEGVLGVIKSNLFRIRDLTEQAANGTYGSDAMEAIATEVGARFREISRTATASEFNGVKILVGDDASKDGVKNDIWLQVGITHKDESGIKLDKSLFADATSTTLVSGAAFTMTDLRASGAAFADATKAREFLEELDKGIKNITDRTTKIGGHIAEVKSAMETANVMSTNLQAASSMIKDADIAKESSAYIKSQILQQSSATLLSTANQAPGIALNLV